MIPVVPALLVAVILYMVYRSSLAPPKSKSITRNRLPRPSQRGSPDDVVTLYQLSPVVPGALQTSSSPFCAKVELFMRMRDIKFTVVNTVPSSAPMGKLPYIEHGPVTLADSSLIVEYLCDVYGNPDEDLSATQRAIGLATQRMLEEHLYFALLSDAFHLPEGWTYTQQTFDFIPQPVRAMVKRLARRAICDQTLAQGMGRHDSENMYKLAVADLDALADIMEAYEGAFFFGGTEPTSIDATVYSFLAQALYSPVSTPIQTRILELHPLHDYCERVRARYLPHKVT